MKCKHVSWVKGVYRRTTLLAFQAEPEELCKSDQFIFICIVLAKEEEERNAFLAAHHTRTHADPQNASDESISPVKYQLASGLLDRTLTTSR